ncbi:hypothetical protein [Flavicella sp.]|uniref:hypothetical protein n=1 Tax=Flavicella sp. TaxID=2957742 RepID=UPI002622DA8C|nr:hypothetical protein [Flavicella sp.]MDG1803805.1 hypothetical protein [Flavicella sp.]
MNYKYICSLLLVVATVFTACKEEEEVNLIIPSHRVIVTSEMDFENRVNINGTISFGDVSAGVVSRKWTLPKGIGDIEGTDNDTVSVASTFKTQFTVVGSHDIKLHQEFYKDAYDGEILKSSVLDTTIVVQVLPFIEAEVKASLLDIDGNVMRELNVVDNALEEVEAGSTVRYSYAAIGEPAGFNWVFGGGDPLTSDSDVEIDVKYKKIGQFGVNFIANRQRPFSADTVTVANLVSIIPSSQPVTLDKVYQLENAIALEFSREIDVNTLNKDDFSVSIENGTIMNPTIVSAEINEDEANIVVLNLGTENVYSDDLVKVSYTQGDLSSTDFVQVDNITDHVLVYEKSNILIGSAYDYSFENSALDTWKNLSWGGFETFTFDLSSVQAQDGSKSGYAVMQGGNGMILGHKLADGSDFIRFDVEANVNYEIGVWVYVEGTIPSLPGAPDLRVYWNPDTNWGVGSHALFTSDFKTGEWVYTSANAQFNSAGAISFMIRGNNAQNTEQFKFYMDNISVSKTPLRP